MAERRTRVAGIKVVAEPTDGLKQINAAIRANRHATLNELRDAGARDLKLSGKPGLREDHLRHPFEKAAYSLI